MTRTPTLRRAATRRAPAKLTCGTGRAERGLRFYDKFAGYGGSTEGATNVPGIVGALAANHSRNAVLVHSMNHDMDHFCGDLQKYDITKFGPCDILWASPACPNWANAKGVIRRFDKANQISIPGLEPIIDTEAERSRLLMDEVIRYLEAMWMLGQPVLGGVIENVIEAYYWHRFTAFVRWFEDYGYNVWVIPFNSMHAEPVRTLKCPQTRDRMYIVFTLKVFGRTPDFDKWLRPTAWCPTCREHVKAMRVFKDPAQKMGRYRSQYLYRCPRKTCRGQQVEPEVLPAAEAIDWNLPSQRIGERAKPLAPKTMARIATGVLRYSVPFLTPSGGTWREKPSPVTEPAPTRTTRESDGITIPPLIAPYYSTGRAYPPTEPLHTVSTVDRSALVEPPAAAPGPTAHAITPFVATLRGGGSAKTPHSTDEPLTTVTGGGFHHLLAEADQRTAPRPVEIDLEQLPKHIEVIEWVDAQILKHRQGPARERAREELGPFAERAAQRLVRAGLGNLSYRMLAPGEIGRTQSFPPHYQVTGTQREIVRGYGNAVSVNVGEVFVSAVVETISGEALERAL